jgi:hypothetical protein
MMRLAAAFTWEDLQTKTCPDVSFKMTNLLPLIKPATLRILVIFFGCHICYISLRLGLGDNRPLSINAYYGLNTSNSPLYDIVNASQVFYRIRLGRYKCRGEQGRGVRAGEWRDLPGQQSGRDENFGGKINFFNEKKDYFQLYTDFKLLSRM